MLVAQRHQKIFTSIMNVRVFVLQELIEIFSVTVETIRSTRKA